MEVIREVFTHLARANRLVWRAPASALALLAMLAAGAGATVTLFAVVNAVFLEPLPYPEPQQLVRVHEDHAEIPARSISYPNFLDWQASTSSFSAMATARGVRATFALQAGQERAIDARQVNFAYFGVLGIVPRLGRDFAATDEVFGSPLVAIVSERLWQSELGGRTDVVGTQVFIDGELHTIVGVAPTVSGAPAAGDAWVVAGQRAAPGSAWTQRDNRLAGYVIARLKPGVSLAAATTDLNRLGAQLAQQYPITNADHTIVVLPLRTALHGNLRAPVLISFGAIVVLLTIVCVNASNFLLLRALSRRAEFALRAALGAGARHLSLQVFAESALFALLGTAIGVALAAGATSALVAAAPNGLFNGAEPRVGLPVVGFSLALMAAVGLLTGLPSALRATSVDLRAALATGSRGTSAGGRVRDGLAVLQIALALALLVCATLLVESMARINEADLGFDPTGVLTFRVLVDPQADLAGVARAHALALEALESLPGVAAAALVQELPGRDPRWQNDINPESEVAARRAPGELINVDWAIVSARYFEALRIPIVSGRAMTQQEADEGAPVMLIDELLARRYWPNGDAVGKHIRHDGRGPVEIVGVARDVRIVGQEALPRIKIYTTYGRFPLRDVAVMVRGGGVAPQALLPQIRDALTAVDAGLAISNVSTLSAELEEHLAPRTVTTALLGSFALVASLLAAVGIYGVVAYATLQRSRELVIRAALGASPARLLRLLLRKGLVLCAAGIGCGLVVAAVASRALASLLYGVSLSSPEPYLFAAAAFAVVALAAFLAPAWRGSNAAPALAMRNT